MKKMIACLLAAAFTLSQTVLTVPAAAAPFTPEAPLTDTQRPALPSFISGAITGETDTSITVKSAQTGEEIVLNLGKAPRIVDGVSGQAVALKDRKSDNVAAYYGPAIAQSMPPQSSALVVMCNIPANYMPPRYAQVESLTKTSNQAKVTIDNGSTIVTINRDTPIYPYLTRNIVSIDNIVVGSQLLMWYPAVTSSYPSQAVAAQTVILGQAAVSDQVTIDNKDTADSAGFTGGGFILRLFRFLWGK